jgi:hypothetical protein
MLHDMTKQMTETWRYSVQDKRWLDGNGLQR